MFRPLPLALALAAASLSTPALASCGSAFCTLMTDEYAQGAVSSHLGWSADLRLEAVTQKRLRRGTRTITPGEVTDAEAIERHSKNLNLIASLGYAFDADWSATLRVPLVRRDHLHDLIDEDTGALGPAEQWRFTKPGDVQVQLRRQFAAEEGGTAFAISGGLKLPTGSIDVANGDGSRAERALQPGTGTTDLLLGGAWRHAVGTDNAFIGQLSVAQALNSKEGFRPGRRIELSVGWSHAYSPTLGTVLQLNARQRARDSGAQAEPDHSGSTTLDLSPGVTFGLGHASTLYAYLQLPVYQKVNGTQLVPRSALALGWTGAF